MLVLTYNFATANSETTIHKLKNSNRVSSGLLISNCELKQEPLLQPNFTNPSNSTIVKEDIFSHQLGGLELFENSD